MKIWEFIQCLLHSFYSCKQPKATLLFETTKFWAQEAGTGLPPVLGDARLNSDWAPKQETASSAKISLHL